jgi:hypothetical protein
LDFDLKGGNRAFVQNDELKVIKAYNSYGFGSAKIVEKKKYIGYIRNGKKLYCREGKTSNAGNNIKVFQSASDAASEGYVPDPKYQ